MSAKNSMAYLLPLTAGFIPRRNRNWIAGAPFSRFWPAGDELGVKLPTGIIEPRWVPPRPNGD